MPIPIEEPGSPPAVNGIGQGEAAQPRLRQVSQRMNSPFLPMPWHSGQSILFSSGSGRSSRSSGMLHFAAVNGALISISLVSSSTDAASSRLPFVRIISTLPSRVKNRSVPIVPQIGYASKWFSDLCALICRFLRALSRSWEIIVPESFW